MPKLSAVQLEQRPYGTSCGYYARRINYVLVYDHIRIAEKAIGKKLPKGAEVHHADGNRLNNKNDNLVICPSKGYHNLLHARIRAAEATGDPNALLCWVCGEHDAPENIFVGVSRQYHRACNAAQELARRRKKHAKTI